jgi:hypothetical protein
METSEALEFLARHQPMPDDEHLDQTTMDTYEAVRKHFLEHYDERCVPLFLGSFGEGSGWGVYQLVEDVLREYPRDLVRKALDDCLQSPHSGVRKWCLQIAMEYEDPALLRHFRRMLSSDDVDERIWSAYNIDLVGTVDDRPLVEEALRSETDADVREILERWLQREGTSQ